MGYLRIAAVCAAFLLCSATASAQRFLWNVDFDFKFDNKEYADVEHDASVTNFTARLTSQIGLGWGRGNALMVGVDFLNDMGRNTYVAREMIVYYKYQDDRFGVYFGRFPRRNLIGTYSNAFFSDYISYYDSNLDGLMGQYTGSHGYVELVLDWNSMLVGDQREKFSIFSAGRLNYGAFYGGYNARMYHHAGSETVRGVVDNILIYPFAGVDFTHYLPQFSALYFQVGWLQTFQNDRAYVGRYVTPGGIQLEARVERWGFGIYNSLYLGGNLMPYYESTVAGQPAYGQGLYTGEPFYRTDKGIYDRLEIYWTHKFLSDIALTVSAVQHYDGDGWGWQQKLELQIYLSDRMFRNFRKPSEE